jgi:ketosteroid isomerase-like protein
VQPDKEEELSAEDNIATVNAVYEAFGTGDVDSILDKVTDDVDWAADAASNEAPWWGQRNGKDDVRGFFEAIAGTVDVDEFSPQSFAANDDEVMTLIRFRMRSKKTGKGAEMNLHHYFHFRDGKIDRYRGTEDTEATAEALAG